MKPFNDFRRYVSDNSAEIHKQIVDRVGSFPDANNPNNPDVFEDHLRAWVENGSMVMLEQYHNWLFSQE